MYKWNLVHILSLWCFTRCKKKGFKIYLKWRFLRFHQSNNMRTSHSHAMWRLPFLKFACQIFGTRILTCSLWAGNWCSIGITSIYSDPSACRFWRRATGQSGLTPPNIHVYSKPIVIFDIYHALILLSVCTKPQIRIKPEFQSCLQMTHFAKITKLQIWQKNLIMDQTTSLSLLYRPLFD